jgi:hypothetical protein
MGGRTLALYLGTQHRTLARMISLRVRARVTMVGRNAPTVSTDPAA